MDQDCQQSAELYAAGALDPEETARFESHLAGCDWCRGAIRQYRETLSRMTETRPPRSNVWTRVSDFIVAPRAPIDTKAYRWQEIEDGVRSSIFQEDSPRGMRARLLWVRPEYRRRAHHHFADEEILVLSGRLRIAGQLYSAGELSRIHAGVEHGEETDPDGECMYYVIHRSSERPSLPRGTLDLLCENCTLREIHEKAFLKNLL